MTETFTARLRGLTAHDRAALLDRLTPQQMVTLLGELRSASTAAWTEPLDLAAELYDGYTALTHLQHISRTIADAWEDVKRGKSRFIAVQMPPRSGKTTLTTLLTPAWLLSQDPTLKIVLASYSGRLATSWGRQIRRWVENDRLPGVTIAHDAGAASQWETIVGGKLTSVSIREPLTGEGAQVMILDDLVKDFITAHSETMRNQVWDWWRSVASTRLEPPSLVIATMTRWHEDDIIGRLLSTQYEGDPDDWQIIRLPAINDEGEALPSPLINGETNEQATERYETIRASVGEYVWSALYQQNPVPAEGAIFDMDAVTYWTLDPQLEADNVMLIDSKQLEAAHFVDSWDLTFDGTASSDWVVGQRWARVGALRILIDQQRGRWKFTQQLAAMKRWGDGLGQYGHLTHTRLVEKAANGAAALNVLKDKITGLKPITPNAPKEVRMRAVTPEWEAGQVLLPLPSAAPWVSKLLAELRSAPHGEHDDQVDAMTQALLHLRVPQGGGITVPTGTIERHETRIRRAATTMIRRVPR